MTGSLPGPTLRAVVRVAPLPSLPQFGGPSFFIMRTLSSDQQNLTTNMPGLPVHCCGFLDTPQSVYLTFLRPLLPCSISSAEGFTGRACHLFSHLAGSLRPEAEQRKS